MSHARDLDQFYTVPEVAQTCAELVRQYVPNLTQFHLVEPSAGKGAFVEVIPECSITAIDIDPRHPAIAVGDFLDGFQPPRSGGPILTIGNPPFGKQSRKAISFFNRAAEFSEVIAFIVPRTFRKPSVCNRLHRSFHLVADIELPDDSFLFKDRLVSVPTCFQVWRRSSGERGLVKMSATHPHFAFCSREEADFAVRRIGARAGALVDDFADFATSSHLFVRANVDLQVLKRRFRTLDFRRARSQNAGVPCVTKAELVDLYAQQLAAELSARPKQVPPKVRRRGFSKPPPCVPRGQLLGERRDRRQGCGCRSAFQAQAAARSRGRLGERSTSATGDSS